MDIRLSPRGSSDWTNAVSLVLRKYKLSFDAEATPDPDYFLVASKQLSGGTGKAIVACAGMSLGATRPFFSERYLDEPIERILSQLEDKPVARESIVEIGSVASIDRSAGIRLIRFLPLLGMSLGKQYGLFTLTRQIRNLFQFLRMPFVPLREAEGERLGEEALKVWGQYYENEPVTGFLRVADTKELIAQTMLRYQFSSREDEAEPPLKKASGMRG